MDNPTLQVGKPYVALLRRRVILDKVQLFSVSMPNPVFGRGTAI